MEAFKCVILPTGLFEVAGLLTSRYMPELYSGTTWAVCSLLLVVGLPVVMYIKK